jgi:hypothetical protein
MNERFITLGIIADSVTATTGFALAASGVKK